MYRFIKCISLTKGRRSKRQNILSVLTVHQPFYISICISTLPTQHTTFILIIQTLIYDLLQTLIFDLISLNFLGNNQSGKFVARSGFLRRALFDRQWPKQRPKFYLRRAFCKFPVWQLDYWVEQSGESSWIIGWAGGVTLHCSWQVNTEQQQ